jgi:hypothetical protein
MAFSDPISLTIQGGSAYSFPRISVDGRTSKYSAVLGGGEVHDITISHTEGKRRRSLFRVDRREIVNDLFVDDRNNLVSASMYLVVDQPAVGFDVADHVAAFTGLSTYLTASTNAKLTAFLNGES